MSWTILSRTVWGMAWTMLASALFIVPSLAQTTSSSITGVVLDAQRAAIPNAKVTATEQERRFTLTITTNDAGQFVFAQIPPGTYTIDVTMAGFKKYERKNIELNANDKLSIGDLIMEVGQLSEQVEVSAVAVQLQTESAERGGSLVGKQMENIAVNGRSYLALAGMVPGVVSTVNLATAGPGGLASISANGTRLNSNQLTINGISNVDTGSNGGANVTVSLDSIQEFKILTGVYQAEYGRSMGAQISAVTKSGTSDFHGSAYWFHRNDSLNATNWLNNRNGLPRNLFRFNDLGFTVGGPVLIPKVLKGRDKLFFFVSQEYQKQLRPQAARQLTVPTALERTGDFSQSIDQTNTKISILDPTTGLAFPNGVIPAGRLYQPGIKLMNLLPSPNSAPAFKTYNFQSQVSDQYPRREDLIRMDYNMTSNMRFFGHYIYNNNTYESQYGSFVLGSNTPLAPIQYANPGWSWAVGNTLIITPTMTNEFNIGGSHNSILIDETTSAYTKAGSGISLNLLYPSAVQRDYIPNVTFAGSRLAASPTFGTGNAPFINYNTTIDITDSVSKIVGRHVLKAGAFLQKSWKDQTSFGNFNGNYNFGDNSANPYDTRYGFSNAALGVYNSFSQAANAINGQYRYWNVEFFVQDTWKITSRLTLDYGIRAAWYQPQYDQSLQAATFVLSKFDASKTPRLYIPQTVNGVRSAVDTATNTVLPAAYIGYIVAGTGSVTNGVSQGNQGGLNKYLQDTPPLAWGPRFGIAYDVTGRGNLVVRTGAGVYYDRFQGNRVFDFVRNPPLGIEPVLNFGYAAQIDPKSALLSPPALYAADPVGKIPTVYNYQFGIQTKLPMGFLLDMAYVGAQFRHLQDNRNLNPVPYGATFLPQNQDPTLSPTALLGNSALPANFLRPLRGFGSVTLYEGGATGNYNSGQAALSRRLSKLFMGINYTWSKNLTTASGDTSAARVDRFTRAAYYGPSSNDRRQNFALNYVYDLPTLNSSNSFTKALFGGWQLSGFVRQTTGTPFTPGVSISGVGSANLTGSTTEGARIGLVGNPNTGTDDPYSRINPAAFIPPRPGSLGLESGVFYLTGPGINNFDTSLQKAFSFKERFRMQLRIDTFNTFNHTQFSGVNSTLNYASITATTPNNLPTSGSTFNVNGFGAVNGARDPRILQTVIRFQF